MVYVKLWIHSEAASMKKKNWLFIFLAVLLLFIGMASCQAESAQVSGVVWLDKEIDGLNQDERGLSEVKVTLIRRLDDGTEMELASARTEKNGSYAFSVSEAGEYCLEFQLAKDYRFTVHGQDSSALPSQDNVSSPLIFPFPMAKWLKKMQAPPRGNPIFLSTPLKTLI